jgi:nuclear transport factor 2 (NTF2) superfamily protein
MNRSDTTPLLDVAVFYAQSSATNATQEELNKVRSYIHNFIVGKIDFEQCKNSVYSLIGSSDSVIKVYDILNVPKEPLSNNHENDKDFQKKRVHSWTPEEDKRLLYGITRFGLSDWAEISKFVGNGRTRSQCSQRWHRSLNPKICKERWTPEDDKKLIYFVKQYGDHSWSKVAQAVGCRTDVQCRYRYQLITKKKLSKKQSFHQPPFPQKQLRPSLFPDVVPIVDKHSMEIHSMFNPQFQALFATHGACYKHAPVPSISENSIFSEFADDRETTVNKESDDQAKQPDMDSIWDTIMGSFDSTDNKVSTDILKMLF